MKRKLKIIVGIGLILFLLFGLEDAINGFKDGFKDGFNITEETYQEF